MHSQTLKARPRVELLEDRTLMSICHVIHLRDAGVGSVMGDFASGDLRFCIQYANQAPGPDIIDFNVTGVISLSSALPDLATDIEINGPGASLLTVRRYTGGDYRIFTVTGTVGIHGLRISNGHMGDGGNIHNSGVLTVVSSVISNGLAAFGGGIDNYDTGVLTVVSSVISSNKATGFGGGLHNTNGGTLMIVDSVISANKAEGSGLISGGGIFNNSNSVLSVVNSTVSGNLAHSASTCQHGLATGGGIATQGSLTVRNSTITKNQTVSECSAQGGGIRASNFVALQDTVLAGNMSASALDLSGTLSVAGFNLIGSSAGGSGYARTDILDVNPLLGPLQDNGGLTPTHALLPGSPAIDAGHPNPTDPPEWDQRGPGFLRIVNGTIDIGAFEVQATNAPGMTDNLAVLITADFGETTLG